MLSEDLDTTAEQEVDTLSACGDLDLSPFNNTIGASISDSTQDKHIQLELYTALHGS